MLPHRIALIHDWLSVYTGSERVVEQILHLFPQADLFSLVDFVPPEQRAFLQGKSVNTSFIQRLPFARRKFRAYLPLMPLAVEQFDLSAYDLIISSSHAVAKGVITGPDQLHVSYIHSPIRYAWDMQPQYLRESNLERGLRSAVVRSILHYLRLWDLRTVNSVDAFAANSRFIARRIRKLYRREAAVIYPPVDVDRFALCPEKEDYYLTVSRLVQYKRVDLIVQAFAQLPDRRLVVIGDGDDLEKVRAQATPNVTLLGYQPSEVMAGYMQRARAFLFAAQEDFGIVPVEAQACGTPVIAYGRGGALETVCDGASPHPTGLFFHEQSADAIAAAVQQFEAQDGIRPEDCRQNAERFSTERFRREFADFVAQAWQGFQASR